MKIGKPKTGGGSNKKYFKLKPGDNVYRILPPLGDLADAGVWAVYYKIHYGYRGLPDQTGKARLRPFVSPEVVNRKTKMVEVADAAKERIEKMKEALVAAKDRGDMESVKQLGELLRNYNLDNKWYVNAINLEGEIGLLKIPHKAKQSLDNQIKRLEQEGVEALGVENGRFFVFNKSGSGRETQYQVSVYKQKIEVAGIGMVEKEVSHTLTSDIISRLEAESHKLDKLYPKPTAEEVARMVKGGPAAVEEILGSKKNSSDDSGEDYGSEDEEVDSFVSSTGSQTGGQTASGNTVAPTVVASAPAPTTSPAATSGVKIGSAQTTAQPVAAETVPTPTTAAQSPEEFLKSMGL